MLQNEQYLGNTVVVPKDGCRSKLEQKSFYKWFNINWQISYFSKTHFIFYNHL